MLEELGDLAYRSAGRCNRQTLMRDEERSGLKVVVLRFGSGRW